MNNEISRRPEPDAGGVSAAAAPGVPMPMDPQLVAEVVATLVLRNPDLRILHSHPRDEYPTLSHLLLDHLEKSDSRGRLLLPDLRADRNQTVAIFSDYSGEGAGEFHVYSVLVCNLQMAWYLVGQKMPAIRERHRLGTKEIAFKDFGMGQLLRSIPDYLDAVDRVPGFLFTLAVDKEVGSLFGFETKAARRDAANLLSEHGLGDRNPADLEKLFRVVHLTSFFAGLLAHNGQRIFWMTDNDAIAANPTQHQSTLNLFSRILNIYTRPSVAYSHIGGAVPFEEKHLTTLDLLSITDVVAGALNNYLSQRKSTGLSEPLVKDGTDRILQWLGHDGMGLMKMVVQVHRSGVGRIETSTLEFRPHEPPPSQAVVGVNPGPSIRHDRVVT